MFGYGRFRCGQTIFAYLPLLHFVFFFLSFSLSLSLICFLLSTLFLCLYHDSLLAMQTVYLIWDVELMWTVE